MDAQRQTHAEVFLCGWWGRKQIAMKGSSAAGCSTWLSDAFMDALPDVEWGHVISHWAPSYCNIMPRRPHVCYSWWARETTVTLMPRVNWIIGTAYCVVVWNVDFVGKNLLNCFNWTIGLWDMSCGCYLEDNVLILPHHKWSSLKNVVA